MFFSELQTALSKRVRSGRKAITGTTGSVFRRDLFWCLEGRATGQKRQGAKREH